MILIKNAREQNGIRRSANLLSKVFDNLNRMIMPRVSTLDINRIVEQTIQAGGGIPAFLGYNRFPASVCTSVNDRVIHGIPNSNPLAEGDILGCDIGVMLDAYYSDACKTYMIGNVAENAKKLVDIARASLISAIEVCRPGNRIKDIGKAITSTVRPHEFGIVYSFCGHGVGLSLHEDPQIPNYHPSQGKNPRLKPGMVLAIEPMINEKSPEVETLDDGWTVVTSDGSLSAHFEHTVLITADGPEVLTSWGD